MKKKYRIVEDGIHYKIQLYVRKKNFLWWHREIWKDLGTSFLGMDCFWEWEVKLYATLEEAQKNVDRLIERDKKLAKQYEWRCAESIRTGVKTNL